MTDKEQIMINGVNVSKCRYFLKDTEGQDYNTDEFVKGCCEAKGSCIGYEFVGYGLCRGDKDCYFKQLARKTQECEKYEKRAVCFKDVNKQLGYKYLTIKQECEQIKEKYEALKLENQEGYEIVAELKHKCEELKGKLRKLELKNTTLQNRNQQLDGAITECDRYREALEEIQILAGKIISNDDQPACVYDVECPLNGGVGFDNHCNENCPFVTAKQILNIINKAKENK